MVASPINEKGNSWIQTNSSEMFLNPYKIPDVIKDDMAKLVAIINQFVFVEYLTPDSIVKLNKTILKSCHRCTLGESRPGTGYRFGVGKLSMTLNQVTTTPSQDTSGSV